MSLFACASMYTFECERLYDIRCVCVCVWKWWFSLKRGKYSFHMRCNFPRSLQLCKLCVCRNQFTLLASISRTDSVCVCVRVCCLVLCVSYHIMQVDRLRDVPSVHFVPQRYLLKKYTCYSISNRLVHLHSHLHSHSHSHSHLHRHRQQQRD